MPALGPEPRPSDPDLAVPTTGASDRSCGADATDPPEALATTHQSVLAVSRPPRWRSRSFVIATALVAALFTAGAIVATVSYQHRVRTGAGPLGTAGRWETSCAPAHPASLLAAEVIPMANRSAAPAAIRSITLDRPTNLRVYGYVLGDIRVVGGRHSSEGDTWTAVVDGLAGQHHPNAIGYVFPPNTVAPVHVLRAVIGPVDPTRAWSYAGVRISYRAHGMRFRLHLRVAHVVPPAHGQCTEALMQSVSP